MAQSYELISRAIVQILENDYAGWPECAPKNNPQPWLDAIAAAAQADQLDDRKFAGYVTAYLATLHDPNVFFLANDTADWQPSTCGFSSRRFGDELVVVRVGEDARFTCGDVLMQLDGRTLFDHLEHEIDSPFDGCEPDRQLWDAVVARCTEVLVRHADGTRELVQLATFPEKGLVESLREPTFTTYTDTETDEVVVVLTFHHFVEDSAQTLLQQHAAEVSQATRVIVDVRDVSEGMLGNAYALLTLFFNREVNLRDLMGPTTVYTRYSEHNARMRRAQLKRLAQTSDEAGKASIQAEIDQVTSCAGKGFVKEVEYEEPLLFAAAPENQYTFLLTDVYTSGVGEQVVAIAQQAREQGCGKVSCVGRATRGGSDYRNLIAVALTEQFSLVYPMGKTAAAHEGCGILECGLAPDTLVPFTPQECTQDLICAQAKAL
ncbi:MAG: hypothetical protein RR753_04600 [Raoultibacter sp.]